MAWSLRRLHIETSTLCNADCAICPQASIQRPRKIDLPRVRRLLTEDALAYRDTLHLVEFHNYNEPLLMFDLFCELTELTHTTFGSHKVGLVSNGSIMDMDKADRLIDLRLAHVLFSVDGFSKEVYETHRAGLNRDEVYNNINLFLSRSAEKDGPVPLIIFTATPENAHEVDLVRAHFEGKRCRFYAHGCDGRGRDVAKIRAVRDAWSDIPCDYALDGAYVLSNLDVATCCEDWSGKEIMGNLAENTLQEIVDGVPYETFRSLHFSGRKRESPLCTNCRTNMTYADSWKKEIPTTDLLAIRAVRG